MTFKFGSKSNHEKAGLHPNFQKVIERALELSSQDFSIHDGARTAAEQNKLYQQGRTTAGRKVTGKDGYKNLSNHQHHPDGFGYAADLVPYHNGELVWDWDLIYPIAVAMSCAAAGLGEKIRWGGNWYDSMDEYPNTLEGTRAAVVRYKEQHPGDDFIDGPHFGYLGKA